MKGIVKANTVDKYLRSIRLQIVELVEPNSSINEIRCGNGDLLFKLSNKIQSGLGIDNSEELIDYAIDRTKKDHLSNLQFRVSDIIKDPYPKPEVDYSIASLLFHILPWEQSVELLKKMIAHSKTTILCGFSEPKNFNQKFLLWLDQRFTNHYYNFRRYGEHGFIGGLVHSIPNIEYQRIDTFDPVIKIYRISKL